MELRKYGLTQAQKEMLVKIGATETITELMRITGGTLYAIRGYLDDVKIKPLSKSEAAKLGKLVYKERKGTIYTYKSGKKKRMDEEPPKQKLVRPPAVYSNNKSLYPDID